MSEHPRYPMQGMPVSEITLESICGGFGVPAVSYWAPRREEIQRFVEIAKAVHTGQGRPTILDVGCGTGFLAYLLADTGQVDVIGMDPDEALIAASPYAHRNLRLEAGNSQDAVKKYGGQNLDVVLNSWMPYKLNLTPDIRNIGAKSIIYVKEREATGVPSYAYSEVIYDEGHDDAAVHRQPNPISEEDGISYHPGREYERGFEWSGPACEEVYCLARRLSDPRAYIGMHRDLNTIDIQFRRDVQIPEIPAIRISDSDKYAWEAALERFRGPVQKMDRHMRFY